MPPRSSSRLTRCCTADSDNPVCLASSVKLSRPSLASSARILRLVSSTRYRPVPARGDDPPQPPAVPARGDDPPEPPPVPARGRDPPEPLPVLARATAQPITVRGTRIQPSTGVLDLTSRHHHPTTAP